MSTITFPPCASIAAALQQVEVAAAELSAEHHFVVVPINDPIELSILDHDHWLLPHPKWFWSPRNNTDQMFCFGVRKQFNSIEEAKTQSNTFPTLLSRPFCQPKKEGLWDEFQLTSLVQPAVVIQQCQRQRYLKVDLRCMLEQKQSLSEQAVMHTKPTQAQHKPEQQEWAQQLTACAQYFKSNLRKVVLARQSVAPTEKSPVELFKMLIQQQPDCYQFFLSPNCSLTKLSCHQVDL